MAKSDWVLLFVIALIALAAAMAPERCMVETYPIRVCSPVHLNLNASTQAEHGAEKR